ncbi:DUF6243 family protein [Streptomyces sp. NPDC127068]|uniref:DUF6243 family protein n=1 Tax=Streptomyces sp. NPDC127068 TaxID=3347127 RepID=UPI00366356FE
MARNGNLLGVGGTRSNLSRKDLRGGRGAVPGAGTDPAAQKRDLLRKLQEARAAKDNAQPAVSEEDASTAADSE